MRLFSQVYLLAVALTLSQQTLSSPLGLLKSTFLWKRGDDSGCIKPKVMIISMFEPEAAVWWGIPDFDILAQNISIPGLAPLFPFIHCTTEGDVCQIVVGESEINAASSISALVYSSKFNLTSTYFMVGGIGGVNPEHATTGSVAFAKYAIQFGLAWEFDAREKNDSWPTGYVPFGATAPDQYPTIIYGTEVFELNEPLRNIVADYARTAQLNDSDTAIAYRANYSSNPAFAAGASPPSVLECDVLTSDVWFTGTLLSEAVNNYTILITNGTGKYCNTAEEDNATLEVLLRASKAGIVDFSRAIVMRTGSDFDRPFPGGDAVSNLYSDAGGFLPALANIYLAGSKVIEGILTNWDTTFEVGVNATNYIGDIFGTLGGTPDFGPADFNNNMLTKRDIKNRQKRSNSIKKA